MTSTPPSNSQSAPMNAPSRPSKSALQTGYPLLLIAIIAALFFLLNLFQPLSADDYGYCFIWGTDLRPASFADILTTQYFHWQEWSGRFVAHCLAQYFLMHDKLIFDLANTLVLLGVALGITRLVADAERPGKGVVFALVLSLFVLLMPATGGTLIWLDGSCNYLWSVFLVVLLLVLLLSPRLPWRLLALLLAPLAGNSHEGISIGLVAFLGMYALLDGVKNRRFSPLLYGGILLTTIGLALNLLAPGTLIKMEAVESITAGGHEASLPPVLAAIAWSIKSVAVELVYAEASLYPVFLLTLTAAVALYRCRGEGMSRRNLVATCLLTATAVQACAILYSGALGSRPWVGVFLFAFLAALVYLMPLVQGMGRLQQAGLACFVASAPVFMMLRALPPAWRDMQRMDWIEQQIQAGESLIVKPEVWNSTITTRRYRAGISFSPNCFFYTNERAARYYGARPFSVISEETRRKLDLIPEESLRRAAAGEVLLLPNGELLLMLPPETRRVTCAVGEDSGSGQEPDFVWPREEGYALLLPMPESSSSGSPGLHIRAELPGQAVHELHLNAGQLDQLRQSGHLTAAEQNRSL